MSIWLFAVAALVFAMVVVGGATRLTGSGVSITEWRPVTGVLPPLSHEAWLAEFQKYQRIPQYQFVNRGMSLEAFQSIYWWEWTHRLLGRVVGVVFAVPFLAFLALRRMPRRLILPTTLLLILGALQGLVGWWMVVSGLSVRVSVAPERLTIHLGLALLLFCVLVWTALEAWAGPARPNPLRRWRGPALTLVALVFGQILLGALVAGNDAGRIYNDWPLMNGRLFPQDYLGGLGWKGLLHSQAAVQFNHRIGAYLVFGVATGCAIAALRNRWLPVSARWLALSLAVLVTAQAILGIVTLAWAAPLGLSLAHQAMAVAVLACTAAFAWRARRA